MRKQPKAPRTLEGILSNTVRTGNGCLEWISDSKGRPQLMGEKVARIVLELSGHDMANPKIYACHTCDNPRCVNPDHLFPGTSSDNQKDFHQKVRIGFRKSVRYEVPPIK